MGVKGAESLAPSGPGMDNPPYRKLFLSLNTSLQDALPRSIP